MLRTIKRLSRCLVEKVMLMDTCYMFSEQTSHMQWFLVRGGGSKYSTFFTLKANQFPLINSFLPHPLEAASRASKQEKGPRLYGSAQITGYCNSCHFAHKGPTALHKKNEISYVKRLKSLTTAAI